MRGTILKLLLIALLFSVSFVSAVSDASNSSSSNSKQNSSDRSDTLKIKIKIGDRIVTASALDNETARDLLSLLPLNLSMKDLFGREKYADLPKALSEKGPRKNTYEVGDIAYWSPDHQIALYYKQDGDSIPSPGIIPIARIDAGTEAFNVQGSVKVTIELVK